LIQVKVNGIFITQAQASGILLKEMEGDRALPIVIGEYEAQSIAMALENIKPPRPITHDLAINLLKHLQVTLENIIITELKDNTYYAVLRLENENGIVEVDSRPSDAIAIAVRSGADIFVDEKVMDVASYIPEASGEVEKKYIFQSKTDELEDLKTQLKKAVDSEEYEKAAQIRDQISKLESGSRA